MTTVELEGKAKERKRMGTEMKIILYNDPHHPISQQCHSYMKNNDDCRNGMMNPRRRKDSSTLRWSPMTLNEQYEGKGYGKRGRGRPRRIPAKTRPPLGN
uniref:Uncharacterized protein n=1 Tax=Heterorhabditis bacteriophora TaxID=37862 RepID=A0A1I7WL73_HETBA